MGSRIGRGMTASGQGALDIGRSGDRPTRHGTCTSGAAAGSVDHDDSTPGRACQAAATHTKSACIVSPCFSRFGCALVGRARSSASSRAVPIDSTGARLGDHRLHCFALSLAFWQRLGWPSPELGQAAGRCLWTAPAHAAFRRSSPALFRLASCVSVASWLVEGGAWESPPTQGTGKP